MPDTPLTIVPSPIPFNLTPNSPAPTNNLTFDERMQEAITQQLPNAAADIPITPNPGIGLDSDNLQSALEEIKNEGGGLTAYDRALMADPNLGLTEGQFYQNMADRMMGNAPANSGSKGIKVVGKEAQLTLGDGSRNVLTAL